MTEPLQNASLLSCLLVGINVTIKTVSLFFFTSKKHRQVLCLLNLKMVLLESIILFLVMLAAICFVMTHYISYGSMVGILVAAVIACLVPTYAFLVESVLAFRASGEHKNATDQYRQFKFVSEENIRVGDSNLPILNAYATGVIPYTKTIIIGKNIRTELASEELEAVVYHEVGYLKNNHFLSCI